MPRRYRSVGINRRIGILVAVGALAIGGTSVWANGSVEVERVCGENLDDPRVNSVSAKRLTPAQRARAVRIALADPLVQALIVGERPRESPSMKTPGYFVFPTGRTVEYLGVSALVTFKLAHPLAPGIYRWRNTGAKYNRDCTNLAESIWTQVYEGEAAGTSPSGDIRFSTQRLHVDVSLGRGRVVALIPDAFISEYMRPVGEPEYLYRAK